jgi:hypothetical protein
VALKNPVGKSYQVATTNPSCQTLRPLQFVSTEPKGHNQPFLPNIEAIAVCEHRTEKPAVVFRAITGPANEILMTFATFVRVDCVFYKIFFKSIRCEDRLQLR